MTFIDPAVDGPGMIYRTDDEENILFKNDFSDYSAQYLHYKEFVGVHTQLTYVDEGEKGCSFAMIPNYCEDHKLRVVVVQKLEKN